MAWSQNLSFFVSPGIYVYDSMIRVFYGAGKGKGSDSYMEKPQLTSSITSRAMDQGRGVT
jgi:hypothetical protein